jgi:hypothetical protein
MKTRTQILLAAVALCSLGLAVAPLLSRGDDRQSYSRQVPITSYPEVSRFRTMGPDGLTQILKQYDQTHDSSLLPAIDTIAAQKDAVHSRLYWYTDLPSAISAAKRENKPILYLRMLGKLTDEYSCANSRFFRTILYSDPAVSSYLRANYILLWQSERPVPVVTIDFGDGRQLKRTLTGNSIHYVLNSDGKVIDAIPGLYSPQKFLGVLQSELSNGELVDPHKHQTAQLERFTRKYRDSGLPVGPAKVGMTNDDAALAPLTNANNNAQAAPRAMTRAITKSGGERRILAALTPQFRQQMAQALREDNPQHWLVLAANYHTQHSLESIELIKSQMDPATFSQDRLDRTVTNLQESITLDTARNEFHFRREILSWLVEANEPMDVETLNQRVYSELFLTPRTDPWLGLLPDSTYTGLYADGVVMAK